MIEAETSSKLRPRRASRLRRAAPSSSAVDSRTVAKRQCSTSVSPRKAPRWVWVLPTSTARRTARLSSNGEGRADATDDLLAWGQRREGVGEGAAVGGGQVGIELE